MMPGHVSQTSNLRLVVM
uniref:Uncharacterized protein n=1 Tax=Anguilla anguilla TaxID=7936 RepID=A0A0E9UKW0_ANGAN